MRKSGIIGLLLMTIAGKVFSQDPHFSQFINTPIYLNPALAGNDKYLTLYATQRSQWRSIDNPFITNHLSFIIPVLHGSDNHHYNQGSVALSTYTDVAGSDKTLKTVGANAAFAYNLHLDKRGSQNVHFALQAGMIQKTIDTDNFQWGEQYNRFIGRDASISPGETISSNKSLLDIGAGIYYTYLPPIKFVSQLTKLHIGFAASHLNMPNESMVQEKSTMPIIYKFHPGLDWKVSNKVIIETNMLFMYQRKEYLANLNLHVNYHLHTTKGLIHDAYFGLGTGYRLGDAFIFTTDFGSRYYIISFTYDANTNSLQHNGRNASAYEISLHAIFHRQHKKWKKK
jgi:type IX secretion system PorP/SprF family membrane protein